MTTCSRCGADVDGYGVLRGLIGSTASESGELLTVLYCYANGCRDAVLAGDAQFEAEGVCSRCGEPADRAPDGALLTTDLRPDDSGLPRMLTFCHANGCAGVILGREGA